MIKIRKATKEDASAIAKAVIMAVGEEDVNNSLGKKGPIIFEELASMDSSQYSYNNAYVAVETKSPSETAEKVVGVIVAYHGSRLSELRIHTYDVIDKHMGEHFEIEDECLPDEFYIDSIAVNPEYRGQGIAKSLLYRTISDAFKQGHEKVGLIVDQSKEKTKKLYQSIGFRQKSTSTFLGHPMFRMQILRSDHPYLYENILVHSCCAPCSGAILEWMKQHQLCPTVFYSNSNIYKSDEYKLRLSELSRYTEELNMKLVDDNYSHKEWLEYIKGLEKEPERGLRCSQCFRFRLLRAAIYASTHGFTMLTTTLASSRWKDLNQVNEAGMWACQQVNGLKWWPVNWRKGNLSQRRSEIIREQNFYNQTFCGCEFSLKCDE